MARRSILLGIIFLLFFSGRVTMFEPGTIYFQAFDLDDKPMPGLVFAIKGGYTSKPTTNSGQTEIKVPATVSPGSKLVMFLMSSQIKNLVILSPMHGDFTVPSFDNNPNNTQNVYLTVKGNKLALSGTKSLLHILTQLNDLNGQLAPNAPSYPEALAKNVEEVSDVLGVSSQELDRYIRHASQLPPEGGGYPDRNNPIYRLQRAAQKYADILPNASDKRGPNLAGNWMGVWSLPDGNEIPVSYRLKLNGDALTGTVTTPSGESAIKNGRISGGTFTFDLEQAGLLIKQYGLFKTDSLSVNFETGTKAPATKFILLRKQ